jgi:hypothetical protein
MRIQYSIEQSDASTQMRGLIGQLRKAPQFSHMEKADALLKRAIQHFRIEPFPQEANVCLEPTSSILLACHISNPLPLPFNPPK